MQNKDAQEIAWMLKTQISLTEWLERIGHSNSAAMLEEDNLKRERLEELSSIINLPFDRPTTFGATEIANGSTEFLSFLANHGNELCALRLIPKEKGLPKLRMRGHTVNDVVIGWFREQNIDPSKYQADFIPHPSDHLWSTIFVINKNCVVGEIIRGAHHQLTQGFYSENRPITFFFDFNHWQLSEQDDAAALHHLKYIIGHLKIDDELKRKLIEERLGARFVRNYLRGYFETVTSSDQGMWFIDYNRILGDLFLDVEPVISNTSGNKVRGQVGSGGKARGAARVVRLEDLSTAEFNEGDILICDMTTPDYISLMKKAGAIVTDRGGILSHAAIVARELGKPCIVGAKNATSAFKDGDMVEVDATRGKITKI